MVKVSIIIPVHNSAQYVRKCFDSCLCQTLKEIQIIAVDDLSQDNSADIIREYEERYPDRFVGIYLEKNLRQGGARNVGIRRAEGEYIAFVDSDDHIQPDMCRVLYENACGAELSGADFSYVYQSGEEKHVTVPYTDSDVGDLTPEKKRYFLSKCGMFWTRIYKRSLLLENSLFFPEGLFFEDAWFNFMCILYASTARKTDGYFYKYYQSPNSTTRNKKDKRKYERIDIARMIYDSCVERGLYTLHKNTVEEKFLGLSASTVLYTCLPDYSDDDLQYLHAIKRDIMQRMPDYRRSTAYKGLPSEEKMWLDLTVRSPEKAVHFHKHLNSIFFRALRKAMLCTVYR